jgi:sulfur-oxidizing protein SoxX
MTPAREPTRAAFALRRAVVVAMAALAWAAGASAGGAEVIAPLRVVGDGIPDPLGATAGDAVRGRALVIARASANCVLCHAVPDTAVRFAGNVGPPLAGVGTRFTTAQLRLRVADSLRINPDSVMPSYYKVSGLDRVAEPYAGKPILTASEVEDVVAWLGTLR